MARPVIIASSDLMPAELAKFFDLCTREGCSPDDALDLVVRGKKQTEGLSTALPRPFEAARPVSVTPEPPALQSTSSTVPMSASFPIVQTDGLSQPVSQRPSILRSTSLDLHNALAEIEGQEPLKVEQVFEEILENLAESTHPFLSRIAKAFLKAYRSAL